MFVSLFVWMFLFLCFPFLWFLSPQFVLYRALYPFVLSNPAMTTQNVPHGLRGINFQNRFQTAFAGPFFFQDDKVKVSSICHMSRCFWRFLSHESMDLGSGVRKFQGEIWRLQLVTRICNTKSVVVFPCIVCNSWCFLISYTSQTTTLTCTYFSEAATQSVEICWFLICVSTISNPTRCPVMNTIVDLHTPWTTRWCPPGYRLVYKP